MSSEALSAKHELFAQALATGVTATEAYVAAGYAAHQPSASRLAANLAIQRRVMELQTIAAGETVETVVDLVRQLNEVFGMAMKNGQAAPAATAVMGKAKLLGYATDRVQMEVKHDVSNLTDDELDQEIERLRKELGLSEIDVARLTPTSGYSQ